MIDDNDTNPKAAVWKSLHRTNPAFTKPSRIGQFEFTSIAPQWQIMRMTERFGPIGQGWGYEAEHGVIVFAPNAAVATCDVAVWWTGDDGLHHRYGKIRGMCEVAGTYKTGTNIRIDDDAGKKAMTDALTKALSHLGMSADVFLGKFDDVKYKTEQAEHFAVEATAKAPMPEKLREYLDKVTTAQTFSGLNEAAEWGKTNLTGLTDAQRQLANQRTRDRRRQLEAQMREPAE